LILCSIPVAFWKDFMQAEAASEKLFVLAEAMIEQKYAPKK
jgi:hypothetical protein